MRRNLILLILLGGLIVVIFAATLPGEVHAQCSATGGPCPEEEKKRPTVVYPSFTPTSTEVPTPTSTPRPTATATNQPAALVAPAYGAEDGGPEPSDMDSGNPGGNSPPSWFDVFVVLLVAVVALLGMFVGIRFGQKRGKPPAQHPPEPGLERARRGSIDWEPELPSPESRKFMPPGEIRGFNPQPEPPALNIIPEAHPPEPGVDSSEQGIIDDNREGIIDDNREGIIDDNMPSPDNKVH